MITPTASTFVNAHAFEPFASRRLLPPGPMPAPGDAAPPPTRLFCPTPSSHMKRLVSLALLSLALSLYAAPIAHSQDLTPRFGLGFNTTASTEDGIGIGMRLRGSAPVNQDLSFAIDLGLTGFIFEGRDEATYLVDPQISAIVSVPDTRPDRLTYFMGGFGAYLPFDADDSNRDAAPTLHFGVGRVHLLTETSLYYEVNPGLIIGEERVGFLLPIRGGVIF